MKKVLGLLLVVAMLMSLAGGALAETNKLGWEVPAETLKVTVFIASDNWTELEEQKQGIANMKDYLLKNFNIELNYQTTDGDAEEAVNLMLASGEYPDVIKGLTTAARQKFVDQGRAVELTSYIENSPNLKAPCAMTSGWLSAARRSKRRMITITPSWPCWISSPKPPPANPVTL